MYICQKQFCMEKEWRVLRPISISLANIKKILHLSGVNEFCCRKEE